VRQIGNRHSWRRAALGAGLAAVAALGLTACGSSGSGTGKNNGAPPASLHPSVTAPAAASCQAVKIGPITRCENFYTAFWPTIQKNMQALYQQALKTDGGNLVIWDWYAMDKSTQAAFLKDFPGLKIASKGLNFNLASAILAAKASGARNSDIVKGSITSMASMYDAGMWQKVDWTKYGVPKEYLELGGQDTGLLPDSINGSLLQYNATKVPTPPTSLDELADAKWQGKVAITNYNAQDFTGYGMQQGQDKMVALIKKLKSDKVLTITNNTGSLLSSGDKPLVLAGQLFDDNPALKVAPFQDDNLYLQFTGVNSDAKNAPGAMLYALWNAFDPNWVKTELTDPNFASSSQPFPGLPGELIDSATGQQKVNMDAWIAGAKDPSTVFETMQNRDKFLKLIDAANNALTK
jgi:spermidine/putrescine-binding protein